MRENAMQAKCKRKVMKEFGKRKLLRSPKEIEPSMMCPLFGERLNMTRRVSLTQELGFSCPYKSVILACGQTTF